MRWNAFWLCCALPALAAEHGYIHPSACRPCHRQIYDAYQQTGMGRSFGPAKTVAPLAAFSHSPSKHEYSIVTRNSASFLRRTPGPFEKRIDYAIGSGNHSVTYAHRDPAGHLFELPLSWYAENGGEWHMSPGYDRVDHSGFSREVSETCLFCHNGYPSEANNGLAAGIDCQRCHGPGQAHAANPAAPIVHPGKLSRDRQLEVCLQCHLESASRTLPDSIRRFGRTTFSYRPGEPLGDFQIYFEFVRPPADERLTVNGAGYGLLKSACFLKSAGRLQCTTCHDPHRTVAPAQAEEHYRQVCRSCHSTQHQAATRDCTGCHMQKRRTEDAVHVIMTSHRIHRHPLPADRLARLAERHDRHTGPARLLYPPALPSNPETRLYLALANQDAAAAEAALAAAPATDGEPYFQLGQLLRRASKPAEALAAFRRAIALNPADPRPYVVAAELQLERGQAAAAITLLEPALARVTSRLPLLNSLAILYIEERRPADALRVLNQAVILQPDDAPSWLNLGVALEAAGNPKGAAAAYSQSLVINPALDRAAAFLRRLQTK